MSCGVRSSELPDRSLRDGRGRITSSDEGERCHSDNTVARSVSYSNFHDLLIRVSDLAPGSAVGWSEGSDVTPRGSSSVSSDVKVSFSASVKVTFRPRTETPPADP